MQSTAATPDEYIASLPDDRKEVIGKLRKAINKSLPKGFKETMGYGMIAWVVPKEAYPPGYHCDPTKPLMLISLASQKNYISLYHMGLYSSGPLLEWFESEWPKHSAKKLDMGKACIRFKNADDIPAKLMGELAAKMSPKAWIDIYESIKPPDKKRK